MVLELAHVRSVKRYTRELAVFAASACVDCVCLALPATFGRAVAAVVGRSRGVRAVTAAWRSASIDVDARGRPCKERLLSIVHERAACVAADGACPRGLVVVQLPVARAGIVSVDDALRDAMGAWVDGW